MLPHHLDIRLDADGHATVEVLVDVSSIQAGAAAHALRIVRDERYRVAEMSADDVLTMREMTALADELGAIEALGGHARVTATVARMGVLRTALETFAAGEHPEREGDAAARPVVYALVDAIADVHADAVRAALRGAEAVL